MTKPSSPAIAVAVVAAAGLALAGCVSPASQPAFGYLQTVPAGRVSEMGNYNTVSGDGRSTCHAQGLPVIRIVTAPAHGEVTVTEASRILKVRGPTPLAYCGGKHFPARVVHYRPQPGYRGPDDLAYEVVFVDGSRETYEKGLTIR